MDDGRYAEVGGIYSYDLSVPRRTVLPQPQVWPVSSGQMDKLRPSDNSSLHRFAGAVIASASIAGVRGES
jgi:hypothetical protein